MIDKNYDSFWRALDLFDEFWPYSKNKYEALGLLKERELCNWLQENMLSMDQKAWLEFLEANKVNGDTSEKRLGSD